MSMHKEKLVVCIKCNGKILREFGEIVKVPFGSEYSIYLKNLNTARAIVNITIDGKEVVENGLIINANSSLDLERFVKTSNLEKGNKLKFIQRNSKIEENRGIGAEDGLIVVSYEFEKPAPKIVYDEVIHRRKHTYYDDWYDRGWWNPKIWPYNGYPYYTSENLGVNSAMVKGLADSVPMMSATGGTSSSSAAAQNAVSMNSFRGLVGKEQLASSSASDFNENGITVAGSESTQKFQTVSSFKTDGIKNVIVLKLVGENPNGKVKQAVTVKHKQKCSTCGTVNKATAKFCGSCGTALEIL
jgi:hypothetical protein